LFNIWPAIFILASLGSVSMFNISLRMGIIIGFFVTIIYFVIVWIPTWICFKKL
jgi:hypothetical protein